MENIRATMEKINYSTFEDVVNNIFEAKRIYIVGLRSSMALAEFLGFYLNVILQNVKTVGYGISDVFECNTIYIDSNLNSHYVRTSGKIHLRLYIR